jgi:hypothetical protein
MKLVAFVLAIAALPAPAHADALADVQASLEGVVAAGGFRAHVEGQAFGPDAPPISGDVDVIFPDRIHARTDTIEFVVTPSGAWVSLLGVWTPADRSMLPVTAFDAKAMRKAIASIRDVRETGRARTSQCPARVFTFTASGQLPGARANGAMKLWACDGNGRPARLEATDARGGTVVIDFDWTHKPRVVEPAS